MSDSCFLIGCSRADEQALAHTIGGCVRTFFALAQRCIWGITQTDLVHVHVEATLNRLTTLYPDCFPSHLIAAFSLRGRDAARADAALQRARDLAPPSHPWHYLLPSDSEWSCDSAPQCVQEVIASKVWRVRADRPAHGTPFPVASQGTLIRVQGGGLVFINPVEVTGAALAQLRGLGEVEVLATQGKAHSRHVQKTRELFPNARVLGSLGHLRHPASAHIRFDGMLGTPSSRLPAELIELPVSGTQASEVVLLHAPSKLLVIQDLVSNNRRDNPARGFAGRIEYFAFGLIDRIGWMSHHPPLFNDLTDFQRSLERILRCEYDHVTGAHWPDAPCGGDARAAFDQSLRWLSALSPFRHRRMVAGYFARQPGFLRDLILYSRAQKKLASQRQPAGKSSDKLA